MKIHITIIVIAAALSLIGLRALQNIAKDEGYKDGYKQGQIDAIQGKVKYALEKKDVWREKK